MEKSNGVKAKTDGKHKQSHFDVELFLTSAGVARTMMEFEKKETLFSQGDVCKNIMYIQKGGVKISVVSKTGKEAVVGMLGPTSSAMISHPSGAPSRTLLAGRSAGPSWAFRPSASIRLLRHCGLCFLGMNATVQCCTL
jgi:hypothetical protein